MIALPTRSVSRTAEIDLDKFLEMLPAIIRCAKHAARGLSGDENDDFLQEVVANCFSAFSRLCQRGKAELAFATVLAKFAIAQRYRGRLVGNRLSTTDVLSQPTQRQRGFSVESLDTGTGDWQQAAAETKRINPADLAAFRIDFSEWLDRLPKTTRKIALALAAGHTTGETAERFGLSSGRVSQMRRELKKSWDDFQS